MLPQEADLAAARAGSQVAFDRLVGGHRRELAVHCYRMTGSLDEADDLVQETLLRAWRGIAAFEGRTSVRRWLYRIATNASLNHLASRRARSLPSERAPARGEPGGLGDDDTAFQPVFDPVWLDPCPEAAWASLAPAAEARISARESVTLAFLVLLQSLPPTQRAVLVLRDVAGWSAAEAAEALSISEAAANSALQRARASLEARRDRVEATGRPPEDAATLEILRRYVAAWEAGDTAALARLLREDAVLTMPPVPAWFRGRASIQSFLARLLPTMGAFRGRILAASGRPAVALYTRAADGRFLPQSLHVLEVGGAEEEILRVDAFMNPAIFARFGLPGEVS